MKNYVKNARTAVIAACFLTLLMLTASVRIVSANAAGAEPFERAEVTVKVGKRTYYYRDNVLNAPDHTVYEQIERRNINASLPDKLHTVEKCLNAGAEWREAVRYAFPLFPDFVSKIKRENDVEPLDSKLSFDPKRKPEFRITRSKEGRAIDEEKLYRDVFLSLKHKSKVTVTAAYVKLIPSVTEKDNVKLTDKISEFSTDFSSSLEGRKNNIKLALSKINGTVLSAGESFSFNGRVGARTEKAGFTTAKIIVGGEYVDGVGGGVCQVSTTLYNAALLAGMNVTKVRNHTILPSYVPPSFDAMVNSSTSDLCFVNPYDTPVFIKAESGGDRAKITFYGVKPELTIKTYSREISRTPAPEDREIVDIDNKYFTPEMAGVERVRVSYGHSGVKSEGYLRYYRSDGSFVREEKIRSDTYAETAGVTAVRPKKSEISE